LGISYDEKPGIQAIGTTAPDRPPLPGTSPTVVQGIGHSDRVHPAVLYWRKILHTIVHDRLVQPFKPCATHLHVSRSRDEYWDQLVERAMDGAAKGARRRVDIFQGGPMQTLPRGCDKKRQTHSQPTKGRTPIIDRRPRFGSASRSVAGNGI
jgi:hypothetical protein